MPCGVYIWTFRRYALQNGFPCVSFAGLEHIQEPSSAMSSRFARRSMGEPVSFLRFLELLWAFFMIPLKLLKLHAYSCSFFLGIGFESFLRMHRLLCYREDDTCARGFQILSQGKDCKNMHVTLTI